MNKRGQFYLIAALLIILAIAGIAGVKNMATANSKPRSIKSIGNELREESFRVIDYGILNKQDVTKYLNNFTELYAPYFLSKTGNANAIFVYGNETNLTSVKFDNVSSGRISASIGSSSTNWNMETSFVNRTNIVVNPGDNNVKVTIFNNDYYFDINKNNEMFYFVIVQENNGEVYVEKS
jgi:hypothetical protein